MQNNPVMENVTVSTLKENLTKLMQKNNLTKCIELCNMLLKKTENKEEQYIILVNRAAVLMASDQPEPAKRNAMTAISIKPNMSKGYYRKGQAEESLLQFENAYKTYQLGIEKCKDNGVSILKDRLSVLEGRKQIMKNAEEAKDSNPEHKTFDALVSWLKNNKAIFPYLYMKYYDHEHRGVHSIANIPPSKGILFVPDKCIMCHRKASQSPINIQMRDQKVTVTSTHSTLAVFLLEERSKKENSFFSSYINILPKEYKNIPTSFTRGEREWLRGSMALRKMEGRMNDLNREYNRLCKCDIFKKKFTFDDFVWARQVVITRVFGFSGADGEKNLGLVPYADMLNHKVECETVWGYDPKREGFYIQSTKQIQQGDQIYDSYGRKCNSRFFVNYGFSIDSNKEDNEAMFDYHLSNPQFHGLISEYSTHSNIEDVCTFQLPAKYSFNPTQRMFSFLRCVVRGIKSVPSNSIYPCKSAEEEEQVLLVLKQCVEQMLAQFETTLEEDDALLDSGSLPMYSNHRNSVVMRRGEKQVYRWYLELVDTCLPLLKSPWTVVKRQVELLRSDESKHEIEFYVTQCIIPLFIYT